MVCDRVNRFQVYNGEGDVRLCGFARDQYLGRLTEHSVSELFTNEAARAFKDRHARGDYSQCMPDSCQYLARGGIKDHIIPYDKDQEYPEWLCIGFENICNYNCGSCFVPQMVTPKDRKRIERNYDTIEEHLRKAMPYAIKISAHGCGELFVCRRTMRLLSEWEPKALREKCSVVLETNGSLFNEKNFAKIENLGQYYLKVAITILSFREDIYQFLSGTKLPIDNLLSNLRYVKKLREQGVIDELELATVVQEQNFREMPEFAKRCIGEFGADTVRLRPYAWWQAEPIDIAWFKDVRNPYHPMYQEYKNVMAHPYLKNPKVMDFSGGLDSEWAKESPYELERRKNERLQREMEKLR